MIRANPRRVHLPAARIVRVFVLTGFFAVVPFLGTAMADPITLSTGEFLIGSGLNQGFYQSTGAHTNSQTTTTSTAFADTQRSFFLFNLADPDLDGLIIDSATLRIWNQTLSGATVDFFDVLTLPNTVKTNSINALGVGIFNDLGLGVGYGGGSVNVVGGYVSFALNQSAINAMNAQDGFFGIGASLRFGGTAFTQSIVPQAAQLVLQTHAAPVPDSGATFALFGLAGAALAVLRRRL